MNPEKSTIIWSDYLKYRTELRGFELSKIENILLYSGERYFDTVTRRLIVVGKYDDRLVIIPYEKHGNEINAASSAESVGGFSTEEQHKLSNDACFPGFAYQESLDISHLQIEKGRLMTL